MWRNINIIMLFLTLLLFTHCTHTVNVALRPNYQADLIPDNELSTVEPSINFGKGQFSDKRADKSKLASFKQGVHTYNLYGERPFEEALYEGLRTLFVKSGHQWSDSTSGDVQVDLQLLSSHARRNAGFIKVGATSSIQVKLDFTDMAANDVIYTQVYNGMDERDRTLIGTMSLVEESINACINDCLNKVGIDKDLARALNKFKDSRISIKQ